jgi:thiamine-monophosphate kinase
VPLAEKSLIRRIRLRAGRAAGVIGIGIGDDCASIRIPPGHEALVTTDFSLEDVHFRRRLQPAASVGHRCLLRGLSDIAAMGGEPLAVFLSLALPGTLPQSWVDEFLERLLNLAKEFGVTLAGGDTAKSPGKVLADILVLGSVPRGKAILRSGARTGDRIFVTGTLGGAATTLGMLLQGRKKKIPAAELRSYFYPIPRIEVGHILRKKGMASSMIDISDGLSADLDHICEESGVGAEINAEAIPRARHGKLRKEVDLASALHGGEDYELLFTAPANKRVPPRISDVQITEIGRIVRGRGIFLKTKNKVRRLRPQGWEYFR